MSLTEAKKQQRAREKFTPLKNVVKILKFVQPVIRDRVHKTNRMSSHCTVKQLYKEE